MTAGFAFSHVTIVVSDLARAEHFYAALGASSVSTPPNPTPRSRRCWNARRGWRPGPDGS